MPEVTVVIPTKNRWPQLQLALRGALAQADVDHEVVVVDDGSTDETRERLAELQRSEPRIRALRHDESRGVARARNRGLAEARGEWVAFLDDDDVWSPRKLRAQLDAAAAAGAEFVYGTAVVVDGEHRPVRSEPVPSWERLKRRLLVTNPVGGPSTFLVRRRLLEEIGAFDETLSALADWDLLIRLMERGRGAPCDDVVVGYVEHGENMMVRDAEKIAREFARLEEKHGQLARENGVEFGRIWLGRWQASRARRAGNRVAAARAYARAGIAHRSPQELVRACVVLLGERAMAFVQRLTAGDAPEPEWLRAYQAAAASASSAAQSSVT